jgi:hypothetical protein
MMSFPAQRQSNHPRHGKRDKPKPLSDVAEEVSFLPHHQHPRGEYDKLALKGPDDYEDDLKEEDLEPALTKDVYSVLYTSEVCSPGFHFSILSKCKRVIRVSSAGRHHKVNTHSLIHYSLRCAAVVSCIALSRSFRCWFQPT